MSSKAKRRRRASVMRAAMFLSLSDGRRIPIPTIADAPKVQAYQQGPQRPAGARETGDAGRISTQAAPCVRAAAQAGIRPLYRAIGNWARAVAALGEGRRVAVDGASMLATAEPSADLTESLLLRMRVQAYYDLAAGQRQNTLLAEVEAIADGNPETKVA